MKKRYHLPAITIVKTETTEHILSGSGPVGNTDPFTAPGFDGSDY